MPKVSHKSDKQWANALLLACNRIEKGQREKNINRIAAALVRKAAEGDVQAIKEIGDRMDGKPAQTIAGDPDNPLQVQGIAVNFVGQNSKG